MMENCTLKITEIENQMKITNQQQIMIKLKITTKI